MENLEFFAGVYGLYSQKKDDRIEAVIKEFRLRILGSCIKAAAMDKRCL